MSSVPQSLLMNHTCLRIKDPKVSVAFYEKHFGMKLLSHFVMRGFTLYMMGFEEPAEETPNWAARSGVLELCHNHGVENDPDYKVASGNAEPYRGFGHICFSVDNIQQCETQLLGAGVKFQKKLSDGRQLNIAFALDPNGYWIELVEHGHGKTAGRHDPALTKFNHTMIRVRDPAKSLAFYRDVLGMRLLCKKPMDAAKFTLYFLGYAPGETFEEGDMDAVARVSREGVIELTHNWGTESDPDFKGYHNGNSTENGLLQGYGHTCVSCDDPAQFCADLEAKHGDSLDWLTRWNQGGMKNLAFIRDPDGYSIEIIGKDMFSDWVDGHPPKN